jgi:ribosomal protein S18 acetylase RimI-like enzyme
MTVALAETNGYRLVNVNVTLCQSVGSRETKHALRLATSADIPALEDLAAKSHTDTRFFNDGRFPIERCEQMYRIWVRKCVEQPRKAVIVAHADGAIAGYSAVGHGENDTAAIELIAVAETHRGKGIGEKLVNGSLAWMAERGVRDAYVRTMGHNVTAQRLYQRCGFRTSSTSLYYHKWFDEEGRP